MILFDFSHSLHRSVRMNEEEILNNINFVGHLILTQIQSYSRRLGVSRENPFVICMDSKPSWRHYYYLKHRDKFPDLKDKTYKGNRVPDTKLPWDNIHEVANNLTEALKQFSDFHVLKIDKCEADDIIAVLAKNTKEDVWVVSSDKDFVQLQSDTCKVFDPLKQAFKPDQNLENYKKMHCMIGDKTDNIPAIKNRLGEKTAIKLLPEIDDMLATDPALKERYEFNANLILFENIPEIIESRIMNAYTEQKDIFNFNSMSLMKVFMKYGLEKHTEDINKFRFTNYTVKTELNQHFENIKKNESLANSTLEDFFS